MMPLQGLVGFPRAVHTYSPAFFFVRSIIGFVLLCHASITEAGFYCSGTGPGGNSPDPIGDGSIQAAASSFCEAASGWGWNVKTLSVSSTYSDSLSGLTGYDVYCERQHQTYTQGEWRADIRPAGWFVCQADEFFSDISEPAHNDQGGSDNAKACSANPINLVNGNKYKIHADITSTFIGSSPARPQLTRFYNSLYVKPQQNVIGRNWRHSYQKYLVTSADISLAKNVSASSGGTSADPLQSQVYYSMQDACLQGFNELVSNNQYASAELTRILAGTPEWNGKACEVRLDGKYIASIPVRAHYEGDPQIPQANQKIRLIRPDGNEYEFQKDYIAGSDVWTPVSPGVSVSLDQLVVRLPSIDNPDIEESLVTYVFTDENQVRETYSSEGRLLKISYLNGVTETLSYVDNLLDKVENSFGNTIVFTYNPDGTLATVADDSGRIWQYFYDAGRLFKVINPDATEKSYHYENPVLDYALTGMTDERSNRYSTFEYYPDGLARSSYLGSPGAPSELRVEDVSLSYGDAFNTVTNSRGYQSKYHFESDTLQRLMTQYDGPECIDCAGGSKRFDYDLETLDLLGKTEYGQNTTYENHDENGNPGIVTEAVATPEERVTTYTYDPRYQNRVATKTEASVYTGGNKVTTYSYDDFGNTTAITIDGYRPDGTPVSRTRTFSYNGPYHQLSDIDGPRTDVDDAYVIDYYLDDDSEGYNRARMKKVTAPLGIVLYDNITYTATGKQASYVTGNSLQVDFNYNPGNDRLETQTLTDLSSGEVRTTRWTYLATGEVESVTQGYATPDATTLTFQYDEARRLTRVYDGFNNYIEFMLDTEGNVISENIHDQAGILLKALDQSFDAYNRPDISTQANETRNQDFSPDGTLDLETDGKSVVTDYSYDTLRRLTSITQDVGGTDPSSANALTLFGYDIQDNLVSVTDPNGGRTSYVYDDLGNLLSLTSPDTGTTVYTHDAAGNITTMTDARGQAFSYSYDALGRVMLADAPGTSDDITYLYDSCENGAGRLCSVSRDSITVRYSYTAFGDISFSTQTVATFPSYEQAVSQVSYTYDAAGRVRDMVYPGGNKVTYTYDAAGNVYSVILNDEKNLVTDAQYYPFGPERLVNRDNGSSIFGYRDQAYRSFINGNGGYFYDVIYYDENGNPATFYSSEGNKSHSYDALDRLDVSNGPYGSRDYDYDLNSNRTSRQADGVTDNYSYDANTNRMNTNAGSSVVLDSNGNTTSMYGMTLNYTDDNRLATITGKASYHYNGLGERAMKGLFAPGAAGNQGFKFKTVYVYGQNGRLLAELGSSGKVRQEYIYMNNELLATIVYQPSGGEPILKADMNGDGAVGVDDYLIWYFNHYNTGDLSRDVNDDGVLDTNDMNLVLNCALSGGTAEGCATSGYDRSIYYAHNDHLGTPHMLTDEAGVAVWSAVYDPFGKATVNEDVDGNGNSVTLNIRFPGQYYDVESELHYNYFRYYDPKSGRYITSDPIGLKGGLNTYGYVRGNPLNRIDPNGLRELQGRGGNPVNAGKGVGRAGVFGCLIGCITYIDGDKEPQASLEPSIGAGFLLCGPKKQKASCYNNKKKTSIYDPNGDNAVELSFGYAPKGAGIGFSMRSDGSSCLAVGLFTGITIPVSYSLGGISE